MQKSGVNFYECIIFAVVIGGLGIHRFISGHILTGILMLLTGGGFGLWTMVDIILLATGNFKDAEGLVIAP